jgi:hypothetical protein
MNSKEESTGQVEIDFAYRRHIGGRFMHGAVKLRFDGSRSYSFSSLVVWPEDANYESHVKAGVEEALLEKLGSLDKTEVQLISIDIEPVDSSLQGFKLAARAATLATFLL